MFMHKRPKRVCFFTCHDIVENNEYISYRKDSGCTVKFDKLSDVMDKEWNEVENKKMARISSGSGNVINFFTSNAK
ncbi:hypothetical protein GCM10007425_04830 [Lysinibacillus alkalisoli]|uniref:Uncharacterized protein n=1 Tax=Lysinibacillus alkalisoli TaxID=1911548 RepID=A0A917D6C7_9BACI|nr:hypothetical protein GCM10007425_04830 [Lysinibacillus alkalisoli]